jgi:hypothetical protein
MSDLTLAFSRHAGHQPLGTATLHAADVRRIKMPPYAGGFILEWVAPKTLCGVKTWGPVNRDDMTEVTCRRCLRSLTDG